MIILEYVGMVFIFIGSIFYVISSLGLIRMPDIYNRMQAATKTATLASLGVMIGVGLFDQQYLLKTITITGFLFFTNPISAHALMRAAHKSNIPLADEHVVDKYDSDVEEAEGGGEDD